MKQITAILIVLGIIFVPPIYGAQIENVHFPDEYYVDGNRLTIQGVGLLKYLLFIKAYVGAFYLEEGKKNSRALGDVYRRIELSYFHAIPAEDFAKAGDAMIKKNVSSDRYIRILPQINQMNALYQNVSPGDRYAVTYIPGAGTKLSINGKPLGMVPGLEFSKAYFSIWLGDNPIDKDFRKKLLGL